MRKRQFRKLKRDIADAAKPTALDKAISWVAPKWGLERHKARHQMAVSSTLYNAASGGRRATSQWNPRSSSPNDHSVTENQTMQDRSRDLYRNSSIARGAVETMGINVAGSGLMYQPAMDNDVLKLSPKQFEEIQALTKREFNKWGNSPTSDIRRAVPFYEAQGLYLVNMLVAGDIFCALRNRPPLEDHKITLTLQAIEADLVSNEGYAADTPSMIGGVYLNGDGAAEAYSIANHYPFSMIMQDDYKWERVPRYFDGFEQILHLAMIDRPGQVRGIPWLKVAMEPIKVISDYQDSEIMAALVASFFTVFTKTEAAQGLDNYSDNSDESGASSSDKDFKMGPAQILDLSPGEDIEIADPKRPNTAFEGFMTAVVRQIGMSLGIPYEVLIKHYTSSYSASRAALMEAWKVFMVRRTWLANRLCRPVFAAWMDEAVAIGLIPAIGYFEDSAVRAAYLGSEWIGPGRGMIDEKQEVEAAIMRIEGNLSTHTKEVQKIDGAEWGPLYKQLQRERDIIKASNPAPAQPMPEDEEPDEPEDIDEDEREDMDEEDIMEAADNA